MTRKNVTVVRSNIATPISKSTKGTIGSTGALTGQKGEGKNRITKNAC